MSEKGSEIVHKPILVDEVTQFLNLRGEIMIIDATLGLGGHSEAILKAQPTAQVIGIDQDRETLSRAKERLANFGDRIRTFHANFSEIVSVVAQAGIEKVDGVVADLGVSSMQLDDPKRGFSFRFEAPLDMRMDVNSGKSTAAELLKSLDEEEIADVIYRYGEERKSRRIAKKIVERREQGRPVRTTVDLANLIEKAIGKSPKEKIHQATRTF